MKHDIYTAALTRALIILAFSLMLGGLITALCSCRTCKPVTETDITQSGLVTAQARTDTVRIISERTDSVIIRDSVFTLVKGDTVFIREYHFRDRTQKTAQDSYRSKADTLLTERWITRTRTVTLAVDKPLPWWKKSLMWAGAMSVVAAIVAAGWWVRRKFCGKN